MRKALFIVMFLSTAIMGMPAGDLKVIGVLEFEEKTAIGQENATVIVPEILMTYLKSIGKYQLAERILLKAILEEQNLQMSDITSAESAAKMGEVFNLDGIVVGSVMKVGDDITINARIIDAENGEVLASGIVEFNAIEHLKTEVEFLAYQLAGYSESEYRRAVLEKELAKKRLGFRLGAAINIVYNQQFRLIDFGAFFHSRHAEVEFVVSPPFGVDSSGVNGDAGGGLSLYAHYYPFAHLGIGAGYSIYSLFEPGLGGGILNTVTAAVTYRANQDFRFCFLLGTMSWGSRMPFAFNINNFSRITAEYFFYKDFSLHAAMHYGSGHIAEEPTGDEEQVHILFLSLGLGYRFSF